MDLQSTKDTILKWIFSCDKEEQIDLINEVCQDFVGERFKEQGAETIRAMGELTGAMADQKILLKRIYFQSLKN